MTSRESTSILPRATPKLPDLGWTNRLLVGAFAAIQWPWLLRSLDGGSKAEKARLLGRLGLAPDALPNLGSWKADTGLLHLVVDHILEHRPERVVEFGCGASSLVIARALKLAGCGKLTSFDQHADFVEATRGWLAEHHVDADIRHAPLVASPEWPGLWYDTGALAPGIDLMIVDGPPWTVHPMTRAGAGSLFALLSPGGTVILDDAARPGERLVAGAWRKAFPWMSFRYWGGGAKGTLIGTRPA